MIKLMEKLKQMFRFMFSRVVIISLAILLQFVWWLFLFLALTNVSVYIHGAVRILGLLVVLRIVNKKTNPSYKLIWTALILLSPVLGLLLYYLLGRSRIARRMQRSFEYLQEKGSGLLQEDAAVREQIEGMDVQISRQSQYIRDYAGFPLWDQTSCRYYPSGEAMFPELLEALRSAKHYIFMEYFIIGDGIMWTAVREILEKKAQEGVDVRLIYDDWGCITTLPYHFYKGMQSKGVKCASFNPYRPLVNVILNNRDHRKICVVDGWEGFTGGVNLADEYINQKVRFGYWKDSAIRLEGNAVWNLTMMFLQMWGVITRMEPQFEQFRPHRHHPDPFCGEGFVQPYCDTPLDQEEVGESVYMNIIHRARRYVYICTPYLIIDNEMMTSLCLAAKSGVDVRIITPGIPDKKTVFLLTQSYYEQLISAGVKIYQYSKGFVHAKSFVCDDEVATIGSINMDYRSLYLHFENGVWIYKNPVVLDMKRDFLQLLEDCRQIDREFCLGRSAVVRSFQGILRLLAPLM